MTYNGATAYLTHRAVVSVQPHSTKRTTLSMGRVGELTSNVSRDKGVGGSAGADFKFVSGKVEGHDNKTEAAQKAHPEAAGPGRASAPQRAA